MAGSGTHSAGQRGSSGTGGSLEPSGCARMHPTSIRGGELSNQREAGPVTGWLTQSADGRKQGLCSQVAFRTLVRLQHASLP